MTVNVSPRALTTALPFNLPPVPWQDDDFDGELIIDSFAGGGGASTGIEWATGRSPDIAINHDPEALALHAANHPKTLHLVHSIWKVDPEFITKGRPVGLLWASPDCTHHSRAKGGKPVENGRRDLAWVVVRWAKQVRPRIICLENVGEFRDWGPLTADMRPDPSKKGQTFKAWVKELKALGYKVEWRELRADEYGAPTIRKRLFLVARCDGRPIVWPAPTHGRADSPEVKAGKLFPWKTAADIIDWSVPCHSIFLSKEEGRAVGVNRPLAEKTMRRLAKGVQRYVVDSKKPHLIDRAATFMAKFQENGVGVPLDEPLHTVMAGAPRHALVAAFMAQHNAGVIGHPMGVPVSTLTNTGSQQALVQVSLIDRQFGNSEPSPTSEPLGTVTAGGGGKSALVAAFMQTYYGADQDTQAGKPLPTVTTRDRFGVVTCDIDGELRSIVDIAMRMLTPRELYRAQGFPETYIIDRGLFEDGWKPLSKASQVRMCGNSVSPVIAHALVAANYRADEAMPVKKARQVTPLPLFAA